MANLEPDIGMGEGTRWVAEYAFETFEGVFVLALLLVYYAQAEQDFVGLIKV